MFKIRYTFDKCRFNSNLNMKILSATINQCELEELFVRGFNCGKSHKKAILGGYLTRFEGSPAHNNVINWIDHNYKMFESRLTYIEIAKDIYCKNKIDAILKFLKLKKVIMMKYYKGKNKVFIRERRTKVFFNRCGIMIGNSNEFCLVVYNRLCKVTNKPILRMEFRLLGYKNIRQKLGFQKYNCMRSSQILFEELWEKYIETKSLNLNRVEKLISLRDQGKVFSSVTQFHSFLNEEKHNLNSQCERYRARILSRPISYYLN